MDEIIINEVGPIKSATLSLNKVNVFMGPQSSGKSTIAKIISFCRWVEKRFILDGKFEHDVKEELLVFHNLSINYFADTSYFTYETDYAKIKFSGKGLEQELIKKNTSRKYRNSKNIYIPSERSFVSAIPNLSKFKETTDNIMSFVYDWYAAKRSFQEKENLNILNLGMNYYNSKEKDDDFITFGSNEKKEILLRESSSGLQSLVPLVVILEHLTTNIFNSKFSNSVEEIDSFSNYISKNLEDLIDIKSYQKRIKNKQDFKLTGKDIKKLTEAYSEVLVRRQYKSSKFIIEEPELNLFPSTQKDLINYIFKKLNDERDHSLVITTHSPYILYAINNNLMGYNISKTKDEDFKSSNFNSESWIDPNLVSIYQIKAGELSSVKDKKTNTVTKHYFNEITKEIMDEYYEMLNFFEFEK